MVSRRHLRATDIARRAIIPLSDQGVRNSRLADIGETMGMSGAHLLYYFESKTALFLASLQIVEQDLRESALEAFTTMESARDRWEWLLRAATPEDRRDSDLSLWLEAWTEAVHDDDVRSSVAQLERDWNDLVTSVLTYGKGRGELPEDLDVAEFVEGFAALLDGLAIRIVVGYRDLTRDAALRLCRMFSDPLLRWQHIGADANAGRATR